MPRSIHAWWQTKQQAWTRKRIAAGAHTLGKRSVFILPTRQGLYLAFFLLAMLLACINYNLSLGYMLTFFVFSVALGAMHRSHQNLLGAHLAALAGEPVLANHAPQIQVRLSNASALDKYALCLSTSPASQADFKVNVSVESKGEILALLPISKRPRGIHPLPTIEISSVYPLGLWRAWSYVFPMGQLVVYPEPHTPLPPMLALHQAQDTPTVSVASTLDHQGDSVSHVESTSAASARTIHWPALAKGQLAQRVLENDAPKAQEVLLSLASCTGAGLEAKLSQLCGAVLHCQSQGIAFVLELNGQYLPASKNSACDAAHTERCLQALAEYE